MSSSREPVVVRLYSVPTRSERLLRHHRRNLDLQNHSRGELLNLRAFESPMMASNMHVFDPAGDMTFILQSMVVKEPRKSSSLL